MGRGGVGVKGRGRREEKFPRVLPSGGCSCCEVQHVVWTGLGQCGWLGEGNCSLIRGSWIVSQDFREFF